MRACDCAVTRFLNSLKLGRAPEEMRSPVELPARSEHELYEAFQERGVPDQFSGLGTAGRALDMIADPRNATRWSSLPAKTWPECLKDGIREAVGQAVEVASGNLASLGRHSNRRTNVQLARSWLISSFPLLGALAEAMEIIEDPAVCRRLGISVAAVDIEAREIYMNPAGGLSVEEAKFVLAHELLHAGLRHDVRRRGRDPQLWKRGLRLRHQRLADRHADRTRAHVRASCMTLNCRGFPPRPCTTVSPWTFAVTDGSRRWPVSSSATCCPPERRSGGSSNAAYHSTTSIEAASRAGADVP
jgi:hypothetical protein